MNNLNIHLDPVPHVETVALGVWFGVGTRDEASASQNGIAHLVEHMLFKGTEKRSALDIVREIENVGAHINAYTGRELTAYTVYALKSDVKLALDILSDMIRNSTFAENELKMEQNVITQEIGMVADTPDDIIHDDAFETAYPDQAFGRPVLGTEKVIKALTPDDLRAYTLQHYHPSNAVISVSGNIDEHEVRAMAEDSFGHWDAQTHTDHAHAAYKGGIHRANKNDLEQTHIIYGLESFARNDKRHTILSIYTEALGGGMASRLFQEVREKRGLAYSVYASNQLFHDTGFLNIYAGTDPAKAQDCLSVIREELFAGVTHLSDADIERAKTVRKAGLLMAQESMMSRADRAARQILLTGRKVNVQESIEKIEAVTRADIEAVCDELATRPFTCALRGPKVDKLNV